MNDPHVKALFYRLQHVQEGYFRSCPPYDYNTNGFNIRIDAGTATAEPYGHFATADEARIVVEPFLRSWEVRAILEESWSDFQFIYDRAEIIDRNPTVRPDVTDRNPTPTSEIQGFSCHFAGPATGHGTGIVFPLVYPAPPIGLKCDDRVDAMHERYRLYCRKETTLPDLAYFCLTALEDAKGNLKPKGKKQREVAAQQFGIDFIVLQKLGDLSSNRGGVQARKFSGTTDTFTPAEKHWLKALLPKLIHRAAEVAFDPKANGKMITMADLPPL